MEYDISAFFNSSQKDEDSDHGSLVSSRDPNGQADCHSRLSNLTAVPCVLCLEQRTSLDRQNGRRRVTNKGAPRMAQPFIGM